MIPEAALKAAVYEHLAKLIAVGDADQLALHFAGQELKAVCLSPGRCAISRSFKIALEEAFPGEHPRVSTGAAFMYVGGTGDMGASFTVEMPHEIGSFIKRFDRGEYPQLVGSSWDVPW